VDVLANFQAHLFAAASKVTVNPESSALPGLDAIHKLVNGLAALGLLACVAAFVVGAGQVGFGNHSNNYSQAADGKERMLKSLGGAFAIGAVAAVINFFYNAGSGVH
jgi:hypothetical protein